MSGPVPLHAEVAETHISVLFLVGDRVYKLKKPLDVEFLDQSTSAARERACHREVELNRRLAPDVYEGVATLTGPDGATREPLVVMRRLPADRRLTRLVVDHAPDLPAQLDAVAAVVAAFHAVADRNPTIDRAASPESVLRLWRTNLEQLVAQGAGILAPDRVALVDRSATAYLAGRTRLLEERVDAGCVCDGHGDLQADDIFCLPDGPRILDCLEFDDQLRFGDIANDVAFLVFDLERLGAPDAARAFLTSYELHAGSPLPRSLLDFYVAYRALVRSKVHCMRATEGLGDADRNTAASLVEVAVRHLRRATVRLILVGGPPGSGKTTLARRLGSSLPATVVESDPTRKELAGVPIEVHRDDGFEAGLYSPVFTDTVYRHLVAIARGELERGRSVVMDASWRSLRHREAARRVAHETGSELLELRCTVPSNVAAARIRARTASQSSASDATEQIAEAMAADFDDWPEATTVDTRRAPDTCVDDLIAVIRQESPTAV